MIKINLCPIDELESQYWYVPDVAVAALVAVAAFFGVQYYLGQIQAEIDAAAEQTASLEASTEQLRPSLERVKTLEADIAELNNKRDALKAITTSKIAKYKPVIVLEHFQNLRPPGVWFQKLTIGKEEGEKDKATKILLDEFELKGQAFDNILVAELITSLKSTASQESDQSDLRTQVYFDGVELNETAIANIPLKGFPELGKYTQFTLKGKFVERGKEQAAEEENEAPMEVPGVAISDEELKAVRF